MISRDARQIPVKDLIKNPLRSLAARIILLVFAATVLSALTVSWISIQSLDGFLRRKVDQRFPQVAGQISRELDHWYTLRTREIEVFATSKILAESVPLLENPGQEGVRARKEAEQYLRYVLDNSPQFERLVVADQNGKSLLEVGDREPLPSEPLASLAGSRDASSIGPVLRIDDRIVQFASATLMDGNDRSLGRLYAIIDLDLLQPTLQSHDLGPTANVFIIDRDGHYLNPPEGLDPDVIFNSIAKGARGDGPFANDVAHYENSQDIRVVGTQMAFSRFGWTLVLEQPYDDAFSPVVNTIGRVAGLNLAIVLLVSLVASRLARSFVKPLDALSRAAKRLSDGEREVELDETTFSSDEVNVLTRTFNEMSRGLDRNARELEKSHRTIEVANAELVAKNTELSNVNLVLEQLSITDCLTKLHNHRYFQESFSKECKRSLRSKQPLSLILIDIDFFKKWNDRLGHAGGDEILRRLAEVLNRCIRETDILTRYGGEEFAVLALNTDLDGAIALSEKIRQAVEEENFLTDVPSEREELTISLGVSTFNGDRQELFKMADEALYSAKDTGRNRVIAAPDTTV